MIERERYACCGCLLPPKDAEIPSGMALNRTTGGATWHGKLVHHVCLPLDGRKWDYFKSNSTEPGFFLGRVKVNQS